MDEIERLLREVSALPWKADATEPSDVVIWSAEPAGQDFVANMGENVIRECGVAFDVEAKNAALIVALVNAAPAMLRAIKAAEVLRREALGRLVQEPEHCAVCNAALAFDAALGEVPR